MVQTLHQHHRPGLEAHQLHGCRSRQRLRGQGRPHPPRPPERVRGADEGGGALPRPQQQPHRLLHGEELGRALRRPLPQGAGLSEPRHPPPEPAAAAAGQARRREGCSEHPCAPPAAAPPGGGQACRCSGCSEHPRAPPAAAAAAAAPGDGQACRCSGAQAHEEHRLGGGLLQRTPGLDRTAACQASGRAPPPLLQGRLHRSPVHPSGERRHGGVRLLHAHPQALERPRGHHHLQQGQHGGHRDVPPHSPGMPELHHQQPQRYHKPERVPGVHVAPLVPRHGTL
mmetsp:Transcript_9913/g.30616  ORF Transcript_9913/g.30616 Transcript_9913/m.30616 type:complete len:284 (+) Transcript_9913:571-1422(+)